jgi:hypothetical protein
LWFALGAMLVLAESGGGTLAPVYPNVAQVSTAATGIFGSILSSSQLSPGLFNGDLATLGGIIRQVRRSTYGSTTDFDAAALNNQGRVISGQFACNVSLASTVTFTDVAPVPPATAAVSVVKTEFDDYKFVLPAVTSSSLVASDQRVRQAEAKTGSYMPLRPSEPTWDFSSAAEMRLLNPLLPDESASTTNLISNAADLWLRGWMIGVEYWLAMDINSSLRIKTKETLEITTAPESILSPMNSPGHPNDTRAMAIIREFSRTEPHAYPADYNEKDSFWGNLVRGIGDVVSTLGIPVLSRAAPQLAGHLADYIEED